MKFFLLVLCLLYDLCIKQIKPLESVKSFSVYQLPLSYVNYSKKKLNCKFTMLIDSLMGDENSD